MSAISFEESVRATVNRIKELLANELLCRLLDESERLANEKDGLLRASYFTLVFREILTKFFHLSAADDDLRACSWFVADETSKNGITRLQRIRYFLHGGFDATYFSDQFEIDVDDLAKDLNKKFGDLSKYVHLSEGTIDVPDDKFRSLVLGSMQSLLNVLSSAYDIKNELSQSVEAKAHDEIMSMFANETQASLDEIAQSHSIDGFYGGEVEVKFTPKWIEYHATGSVTVEQYYGSRDDSCTIYCSYPVSCIFTASFEAPNKIEIKPHSLVVDTASWYGVKEE